MKKLVILVLLGFCAWTFYKQNFDGSLFDSAMTSDGVLFTSAVCGAPCLDAKIIVSQTKANIEEVILSNDDRTSMQMLEPVGGGSEVPVLVTSNGTRIDGFNEVQYLSAIADELGLGSVPSDARQILGTHFDGAQPKLVMYGTSWCPYCAKARKFMDEEGIAYEERDVEKNSDYMAMYKWLDSSGYPLIYYGAKRLQGFDADKLQAMINK